MRDREIGKKFYESYLATNGTFRYDENQGLGHLPLTYSVEGIHYIRSLIENLGPTADYVELIRETKMQYIKDIERIKGAIMYSLASNPEKQLNERLTDYRF